MQGTWVWFLVQEDPTYHRATKPRKPQLLSPYTTPTKTPAPRAHALQQKKLLQWEACAPKLENRPCFLQLEKAHIQQQRPSATKNKQIKSRGKKKKLALLWLRVDTYSF